MSTKPQDDNLDEFQSYFDKFCPPDNSLDHDPELPWSMLEVMADKSLPLEERHAARAVGEFWYAVNKDLTEVDPALREVFDESLNSRPSIVSYDANGLIVLS